MNAEQERDAARSIARAVCRSYADASAPVKVRLALVACRRHGYLFGNVWFPVVEEIIDAIDDAAERGDWASIVGAQCATWGSAYYRRGRPCRGFANLDLLADVA